jgi:hypothetical protein
VQTIGNNNSSPRRNLDN